MRDTKRTRHLWCALVLVAQCAYGIPGMAGFATESTQTANRIQLVLSQAELASIHAAEVEQIIYEARKYQVMLRHLKRLPDRDTRYAAHDLMRLLEIVRGDIERAERGRELTAAYNEQYRDTSYYRQRQDSGEAEGDATEDAYRDLSADSHAAVQNTLVAADLQEELLDDEAAAISAITEEMESAEGQAGMLDALYKLSVLQIEQSQKIRQLLAAQIRMEGAALAAGADRAAQQEAIAEEYAVRRVLPAAPADEPVALDGSWSSMKAIAEGTN